MNNSLVISFVVDYLYWDLRFSRQWRRQLRSGPTFSFTLKMETIHSSEMLVTICRSKYLGICCRIIHPETCYYVSCIFFGKTRTSPANLSAPEHYAVSCIRHSFRVAFKLLINYKDSWNSAVAAFAFIIMRSLHEMNAYWAAHVCLSALFNLRTAGRIWMKFGMEIMLLGTTLKS
jgi:hypothetical protein